MTLNSYVYFTNITVYKKLKNLITQKTLKIINSKM